MNTSFGYMRMPSAADCLSKGEFMSNTRAAGRRSTLLDLLPDSDRIPIRPQKRYLNNKRESAMMLPSATSLEMTKQSFIQK